MDYTCLQGQTDKSIVANAPNEFGQCVSNFVIDSYPSSEGSIGPSSNSSSSSSSSEISSVSSSSDVSVSESSSDVLAIHEEERY